ncbi:MAG: FKBP-type peptidyl-prolyl cis-trans isomerase [Pseudomonadota bacterium]
MKIARGLSVELAYELKIKGGDVIESSDRSGPLRYVHGDGKMLAGLEKRLEGLSPGDESKGVIPAKEAFGNEDALPVREMPRSAFPAGTDVKPGSVFQAKDPATGTPVTFKVLGADANQARVRLLHPLADRDIEFRVTVLAVRDPRTQGSSPPPIPGLVELDPDEMAES